MATDNHGKVYVNKYGKRVMRITDVIKVLAKDQIAVWANMLGFKKISYKAELNRTANIGSMVHAVIEDFSDEHTITMIKGYENYDIYTYGDKKEVQNAIRSFFFWYEHNKELYKVIDTEVQLIGEEVGGTADTILQSPFNPDHVIIGDYKTSKGVYFSMYLQLGGYVKLYEELNGEDTVDGVVVFQLDKKNANRAKAKFINRENMQKYIDAFEALLHVAIITKSLEEELKDDMENYEMESI